MLLSHHRNAKYLLHRPTTKYGIDIFYLSFNGRCGMTFHRIIDVTICVYKVMDGMEQMIQTMRPIIIISQLAIRKRRTRIDNNMLEIMKSSHALCRYTVSAFPTSLLFVTWPNVAKQTNNFRNSFSSKNSFLATLERKLYTPSSWLC